MHRHRSAVQSRDFPIGEGIENLPGREPRARIHRLGHLRVVPRVTITTRALPVGTQLWAKASYGPAWRAVVIESTPERLGFVAHNRFVGDLFTEDSLSIALHERLDAGAIGDAVLVDVGSDVSGFREKLASAFDCADGLGI